MNAIKMIALALERLSRPKPSMIESHLDSLKNLPPEFSRVDMLRFQAVIPSGATPTIVQPANDRIPSDMDAELWGIQGYVQDPDTEEEDQTLVTVKLKEQGRGHDLFSAELNMSQLVGREGSKGVVEFPRGIYVIQAGKTITCQFSVNAVTNITAYNSTAGKLYGICLWFNLKRPE
jgi:hypothetical protein